MTDIVCRPLAGTDLYELVQEVVIRDKVIPAGFRWDGASIPRWLWDNLGYGPYHPCVMAASLYHDYGYRRDAPDQGHQDRTFYELLLENGANRIRARVMYRAVQAYREDPADD